MAKVAIMQPYFVPYAGYFRLFATADVVVMYDCVQFPRRGWVHRNRLPTASGELDWLTLPVLKCDRDTPIANLRFAADAHERLESAVPRFPLLARARVERDPAFERMMAIDTDSVATYLCDLIADINERLGLTTPMLRSSELEVAPELHGQDRILAIAQELGASVYINAPGGRELYDAAAFAERGIELFFLSPYTGSMESILSRLMTEPVETLADEIARESRLVSALKREEARCELG